MDSDRDNQCGEILPHARAAFHRLAQIIEHDMIVRERAVQRLTDLAELIAQHESAVAISRHKFYPACNAAKEADTCSE